MEVKFPGPLQIATARNRRCEYYSSHNVLIVILHKDNLITFSFYHVQIFFFYPLYSSNLFQLFY